MCGLSFEGFELLQEAQRDLEKIKKLHIEGLDLDTLKIQRDISSSEILTIEKEIMEEGIVFEGELGRSFREYLSTLMPVEIPEKNEPRKPKTKKKTTVFRVLKYAFVASIMVAMLGTALMFYLEIKGESEAKKEFFALRDKKNSLETYYADAQIKTGEILPEYQQMHIQNPDMQGWLSIEYTNVDYPVMFREDDNDYYLSRNFQGEPDVNGMLILDKRCDPTGNGINMLIHGHNMKSGMMFGALRKYMDSGYLEDHKYINYDTLYDKHRFVIISVFISSVAAGETDNFRYYNYIDFDGKDAFDEYIKGVKEASLYDTGESANYGDKLITLSTCDYSITEGRLVIVGREIIDDKV